ncbi:hypothetical protein DSM104443_00139 [Usitatibacter rugosus]|uniref:Uncharacterized protein n=1 Tax=Usitatibacter rugosus TaxID=2732067 RepID=A0A6M4GS03_9PROT|nr:hypothetical protein [Usitatibacter rugosus]QJR09103.1 hypothetical protein DSM104443_00139 [Usitatibacter rugosus]
MISFIQEFALLFAVATPLAVIFAMNVFLMLEGERGTLMLPSTDWTPQAAANDGQYYAKPANDDTFSRVA